MTAKHLLVLACLFTLAGCGTLQVDVDTPATGSPSTQIPLPEFPPTFTPSPTVTTTPTPTDVPTASLTPSPTPKPVVTVPIAAGHSHTCAVTSAGGIKCWGDNEHGQLGDGTTAASGKPVDVNGLEGWVTALAAGWGHTCALTADGAVWCWGYNKNGELGNGGIENSALPVKVAGLPEKAAVLAAGDDHTCVVTAGGAALCWGLNEYGQLGDGTQTIRAQAVEAGGFTSGIHSIAAGWGHTCALTAAGGVKCWGNNEYGQLGYGEDDELRLSPMDPAGLTGGVAEITAGGGHTCARMESGGVHCWGNNTYGQLGDGAAEDRLEPVSVIGLAQAERAVTGWNHSCAVSGGSLMCWGWNYYGQLGDGTKATRLKPRKVAGLTDGAAAVAVGWAHTCAAGYFGRVACWGANESGQLGDGTTTASAAPVYVPGLETAALTGTPPAGITPTVAATAPPPLAAVPFSAGEGHTCALTAAGGVKCWGENQKGQLGDGSGAARNSPVDVIGLAKGAKAVEAGVAHTCAVTSRGGVKCWGANEYGQLGDGTKQNRAQPVDVAGISSGIVALAAGEAHTCALTARGAVKCWGWNKFGQLGDGTVTDRLSPVDVSGLPEGIAAITAGENHTCALSAAGMVVCWGSHSSGKGDYPFAPDSSLPALVEGLSGGVQAIFSGASHNCARTDAGGVKCWGANTLGQFGDGTTGGTINPVEIILPAGIIPLAGSQGHACGVSPAGKAFCWGLNDRGQLGDGTRTLRLTPVEVSGLTEVVAFALGYGHSCALTAAGEIWCWGANEHGELGDGTNATDRLPVRVTGW